VDGSNQRGPDLREFADGAAHTLLFAESGANKAVSWTKPDNLEFDVNSPLEALGTIAAGPINAVTAEGGTIKLLPTIDPDDFKALVTINGGELVDAETLSRQYREESGIPPADPVDLAVVARDQFRKIALDVLNFHDSVNSLPADFIDRSDGSPILSWRVVILPFLGYQNLYDQFQLDESRVDKAVPWTEPGHLLFNYDDPLATLRNISDDEIRVAMLDAKSLTVPADIAPSTLLALVSRDSGEILDAATLRNRQGQIAGQGINPALRTNDLKTLVLAMHNYLNTRARFPGNRTNSEGTPLLSWRVEFLPLLEQQNLYDQFRRDEPWDSPHNLELMEFMPDIFRSVGDPPDSKTTRVMHFTGPEAPFPSPTDVNQNGPRIRSILDGTSNTVAFVEAGVGTEVPWTKPSDLEFNENNPFSVLGKLGGRQPGTPC